MIVVYFVTTWEADSENRIITESIICRWRIQKVFATNRYTTNPTKLVSSDMIFCSISVIWKNIGLLAPIMLNFSNKSAGESNKTRQYIFLQFFPVMSPTNNFGKLLHPARLRYTTHAGRGHLSEIAHCSFELRKPKRKAVDKNRSRRLYDLCEGTVQMMLLNYSRKRFHGYCGASLSMVPIVIAGRPSENGFRLIRTFVLERNLWPSGTAKSKELVSVIYIS